MWPMKNISFILEYSLKSTQDRMRSVSFGLDSNSMLKSASGRASKLGPDDGQRLGSICRSWEQLQSITRSFRGLQATSGARVQLHGLRSSWQRLGSSEQDQAGEMLPVWWVSWYCQSPGTEGLSLRGKLKEQGS